MARHIVDYRAPVVLHPILLARYYPYLDDDGSGHFQVGRGYQKPARPTRSATSSRGTSSASTPPSRTSTASSGERLQSTGPTRRTSSTTSASDAPPPRGRRRSRSPCSPPGGCRGVRPTAGPPTGGTAGRSSTDRRHRRASRRPHAERASTTPRGEPDHLRPLRRQPSRHGPRGGTCGPLPDPVATDTAVTFEPAADGGPVDVPAAEGRSTDACCSRATGPWCPTRRGGETTSGAAVRVDLSTDTHPDLLTAAPVNGGTWALYEDRLLYPTHGEGGAYCVATLDLATATRGRLVRPDRHGFSRLTAGEHGEGLLGFDATRPVSCRTVHGLDQDGRAPPVGGPTDVHRRDGALTATARSGPTSRRTAPGGGTLRPRGDGEVRSSARDHGQPVTWCGDAYFVRDPARRTDPARLMRWDGSALSVAYESASTGNAFLGEPGCADGILTVSSFGEAGDEQVCAQVG